jgi:hypothetical protein
MPALPALVLAAALVVGAPAATTASCTPSSGGGAARTSNFTSDSGSDPQVSFSADCDAHDHAFNVRPNTPQARRAAEHTCQVTGAAVDAAPWPAGWSPVALDSVAGGDR